MYNEIAPNNIINAEASSSRKAILNLAGAKIHKIAETRYLFNFISSDVSFVFVMFFKYQIIRFSIKISSIIQLIKSSSWLNDFS